MKKTTTKREILDILQKEIDNGGQFIELVDEFGYKIHFNTKSIITPIEIAYTVERIIEQLVNDDGELDLKFYEMIYSYAIITLFTDLPELSSDEDKAPDLNRYYQLNKRFDILNGLYNYGSKYINNVIDDFTNTLWRAIDNKKNDIGNRGTYALFSLFSEVFASFLNLGDDLPSILEAISKLPLDTTGDEYKPLFEDQINELKEDIASDDIITKDITENTEKLLKELSEEKE